MFKTEGFSLPDYTIPSYNIRLYIVPSFLSLLVHNIIIIIYAFIVGEAARRPLGNLYKLDGNMGTVYSGRKDGIDRSRKGKELEGGHGAAQHDQEDISYSKGASVSGQMEQNVEVCTSLYLLLQHVKQLSFIIGTSYSKREII